MPDHPRLFVRRSGTRAGLSIRRRNKPDVQAAGLAQPLRRRDQQSEVARRSLVRGTHPYANATAHSVRGCRREYSGDADSATATPLWLTPPAAAPRTKGSLELQLPPALPQCPQPQRVEPDEARCVAVVVGNGALLEGDEVLVIERIGTLAADYRDAALVELEPHAAADEFLALVDRRLQHLTLGREPEAVVDQLGIFRHQLVLEVRRATVERDLLDAAMRRDQDGAAGRLVHAARLHADEAVLNEIEPADAMGAPEP